MKMHPLDIAVAIRALNDMELTELVSYLASDYEDGHASSIGTMQYIFNTSSAQRKARAPSALRQQAKGY